jgi:outer membrane biogenesis lipoprotein LolB
MEKVLRVVLVLAAALALLAGCDAAVGTPADETGSDGDEARGPREQTREAIRNPRTSS